MRLCRNSTDPCGVHSNVNVTKSSHCLLDRLVYRRFIGDIYLHDLGFDMGEGMAHLIAGALQLSQVDIYKCQGGNALFCKFQCRCFANPYMNSLLLCSTVSIRSIPVIVHTGGCAGDESGSCNFARHGIEFDASSDDPQ